MAYYKDKEWLYRKYVTERLTSYEIGDLQGCSATTIRNWLKKYDIEIRGQRDYPRLNISKELLEDLYITQYKTILEVAKILSTTQNTVIKYLRKYGIESRRVTDYPSFIEGHNRMRKKLEGKPRSLETRLKISKSKTIGEWAGFATDDSIFKKYRNKPVYKKWRQSIFERDAFTCQDCDKKGGYLELHHIIPLRDYEEGIMQDNNAITLCRKCHGRTKAREYEFVTKYCAVLEVA